ncbi:MAG: hypothetical protein ACLGIN_03210 [Candidatus Sericytochromatia bacterium]
MSQPSVAALPVLSTAPRSAGPSLLVEAPLSPGWAMRAGRLEAVVKKAAGELARRERRATRLTVTVRFASGRSRSRSLALPRPTARPEDMMPVALGLLRLLIAEQGEPIAHLGVRLGALVEGANQPISFQRYLARKRPQGLARLASLVGAFGLLGGLLGGR